jgi:hypothetical protein
MSDSPENGAARLDSWKAIAAYLGKDESTVRRWERQLGLPVRRVPGGRGTSVFAYRADLDRWLATKPATEAGAAAETEAAPASATPSSRRLLKPLTRVIAAAALAAAAWIGWRGLAVAPTASASLTDAGIVARDANGAERWRYDFPPGERPTGLDSRLNPVEILPGGDGILASAGVWVRATDDHIRSGTVFQLSESGRLERTFSLDDRLTFAGQDYAEPWGVTDYRVGPSPGPRRIAVAAHHYRWWPSVVTILADEKKSWRRLGSFMNAGWIERVHWLSSDRLLVAGYNEAIDGGVVALLDPAAMNGQVPLTAATSKFVCDRCGNDRPLRYWVMPRSEVNLASGSRFNRAITQVEPDLVVARTVEQEVTPDFIADAVYEFDTELNLKSANFSGRYWEQHRSLEQQGKIAHSRSSCPYKDGPGPLREWNPAAGWRDVRPPGFRRE